MTVRSKLKVFVAFFLLLTGVFIAGSVVIYEQLSHNYKTLTLKVESHGSLDSLELALDGYIHATREWAATGNRTFRNLYRAQTDRVYAVFDGLARHSEDKETLERLRSSFSELKEVAREVILIDQPVGSAEAAAALRRLEEKERDFQERLREMHNRSLEMVNRTVASGKKIQHEVVLYLIALLAVSSLSFVFLALFMRKVIAIPFNDVLTASDRIMSGDRNYRIASTRDDEFGVIANRFDTMVNELQNVSAQNEDLYLSTKSQLQKLSTMNEITKAITSTLDLDELLERMAMNATELLGARGCIIRLQEDNRLVIKASFGLPKEVERLMTLQVGEGLPGKVASEGRPLLIDDLSKLSPEWKVPYLDAKSVMNVPLKVGSSVIGTFAVYDKKGPGGEIIPFTGDDLKTAEGFASLSAIAIDKAKMYEMEIRKEEEALEAKRRLDVLFESVQGGIITLSRDYRILSANRFVERWMNMSLEELVGRNATELFHGKKGICPHCVAQVTCESGEINTITQVSGLNYAELTSYPIRDAEGRVSECVVYILDITDRVLYQEEMLALYREGTQTKEYLESLIENSADAIVTSDPKGSITSWNHGAERIYGYSETEAVGKYLPFVPDDLKEVEQNYSDRVMNGEILKDIETVRQRRDGALIEVSLTLSPIKDASGEIIGISGISRDISEKKRVEKELIRKNQELSRLFFISSAMRSTLELDRLLRMILTAVTMGEGLGFNRAVLFLVDEGRNVLKGAMGVGPANYEEAGRIWGNLDHEQWSLSEVMAEIEGGSLLQRDSFLNRLSTGIEIPLSDNPGVLASAVREKRPFSVPDARTEERSDALLIQQFGTESYAVVPLISRDTVIGVLWVDNLFNKRPITEEDMRFLSAFSNQVASAIESAKLFEKVSFAEAELENIFRSISDMVYFTDMDYTIRSVNKAVEERFGKPREEIVGKKCYEVFHGTNEPRLECPHHRTVTEQRAFVEEVEDPFLGGMFLTSTSPIFDTAGHFLGTVHIVRNITEIKLIQERLASSERMAALGEVAAKVAHEIRNPLVSVGGFAQRLEKKLNGELKEYASIITNEVKRLEVILKDILGFVREVRLTKSEVDVNAVLTDITSLVESEAADRGIALQTDLGAISPSHLDADRIKEAFLNIVNNAMQAVDRSGAISIRTSQTDAYVVAEVHDTGSGISEKDIPFIFDPFYTTKPTGTGLGLAITRRIVEEHKGRIEVKSKAGEGTTIRVLLPRRKEEA